MSEETEYLKKASAFSCPSCGSKLKYSAEHKKIACAYCGYTESVNPANDQVIEQRLDKVLESTAEVIIENFDKKVFDCESCGAKFMVEADKVNINCGFCGSTNVNLEGYEHRYIQPQGIIPFQISRHDAEQRFNKWIRQGIFHPNKLKSLAALENLHGIYLPFWTFDVHTESDWSGEAGTYYYETRRVRINGRMQTQRVRHIRWHRRSGHLKHFFDDVLVVASGGLDQRHMNRVLPFLLDEVVNFDQRLMVGWEAEIYNINVDEGAQRADNVVDYKLRSMCSSQLGGDEQRNLHIQSHKYGQTFKHIILPVWICSYKYNNEIYHFTINGQTGKVYGKKPTSYWKIAGMILLFVLFIASLYFLKESGVFQ